MFKTLWCQMLTPSRDFIAELESDKYDDIKTKKDCHVLYRWYTLRSYKRHDEKTGFKDVYQIDGGIVKYGEAYGDDGLWEGSLRV